ncbi:MAG: hypothetical protein IKS48_11805 [Eubacterium sp.]|nr:hypothetical protein [Eubacterium sp.]
MKKRICSSLVLLMCLSVMTGCEFGEFKARSTEDDTSDIVYEYSTEDTTEDTSQDVLIVDATNNNASSNSQLDYLYNLLEQDQDNDGKAVEWDGDSAKIIDDELDQPDIDDGRAGEYASYDYKVDKLIRCSYREGFTLDEVDESEPDKCHFTDGNIEIFVTPIDYASEESSFSNDVNYKEMQLNLKDDVTKYYETHKSFFGLKDIDGTTKAGYVLIFKSNLADRSYKIEVYGTGNMTDVAIVAYAFINEFDVDFY